MSRLLNGFKSFVHSISTSDHYAAYDPARPQGQEDAAPLASSSTDRRSSSSSANTSSAAGGAYAPGMRTQQMGSSSASSIPLNEFSRDGPPIPSATLSWTRIDSWIEQNYPELFDQMMDGATTNDLNDLEHDLDCNLPADVRESFDVHDGQEKGGQPTGIFYGVTLLDLEGVSEEWNVWRQTAIRLEEMQQRRKPQPKPSSSAAPHAPTGLSWIDSQQSCPPEQVQCVYAHPGWIPLAKDFDGNNIAVDLAPGPKGRYGQVILFGRDFDVKYVVAPSWGDFLAQFAADLESGSCYIDDDVDNPVFAFKSPEGRLVSYFNVLRQRVDRTLPSKSAVPRRSVMSASASSALTNSGRTTPRLVSPTGSTTSLHRANVESVIKLEPGSKNTSSARLAQDLNEVDLSDNAALKKNKEAKPDSKAAKSASAEAAASTAPESSNSQEVEQPAESDTEVKASTGAPESTADLSNEADTKAKDDAAEALKTDTTDEPQSTTTEETAEAN